MPHRGHPGVRVTVVWRPDADRVAASRIWGFMSRWGVSDFSEFLARSVARPDEFWDEVVRYLAIPFRSPYREVRDLSRGVPWTRWFTDGVVNLSEVCVDRWAAERPDGLAVVAESEDGRVTTATFEELESLVARAAGGMRRLGVGRGDAVASFLPMCLEAVVTFLAAARIGAILVPVFSGFGPEAVAARIRDPRPKVMVCADGFTRRGRPVKTKDTADEALSSAPDVKLVVVERLGSVEVTRTPERDVRWEELLSADPVAASPTDSEDPVMIAYTSGTTGRPKGAVHVHGGFTVKVAAEGAFQADVGPGDLLMWATDMGWIMGPWSVVAALANGAGVVCYDGAFDHPTPNRIWELVERHRITILGLSPTLIRALRAHGAQPSSIDISSLRAFGSTGEPLNDEPWWWLFRDVGGERIPIVNMSGGTEVGACIVSVNLLQGIKPTSVGGPSPGMAADVFDSEGRPVRGEVGELVVTAPWPGMTRGFWREPDRYLEAYWSRWPDVWVHGDWASVDSDGFWYLHGRSDDTLNVGGKRIGPAEIESAVVAVPGVLMAAAVGLPDPTKGERIVVYAVPSGDPESGLADRISEEIVRVLGKPFAPAAVHLVPDLPRTRSAKIMRRVIRNLALGLPPGDLSALENPDSLEFFEL